MIITLDGPSGVGKSSVSKALAERLSFTYIDTGAMYRGVALTAHEQGVPWDDEAALVAMIESISFQFKKISGKDHLFINGRDMEPDIRSPLISGGASAVATLPRVREGLVAIQREMGQKGSAILEGRDTGTVVFPQADLKFFLDAPVDVRAQRRHDQYQSTDSLEEIQLQISQRDKNDSEREASPLICADDAMRIDTSQLSLEGVIETILERVQERQQNKSA